MRNFCSLLIFFLKIAFCFGQADTIKRVHKKWSIGLILLNEANGFSKKKFSPNFLNGLVVKRHFHSYNVRLAIEYVKLIDEKDEPKCCDQISSEGYLNETMIRIGVEKGITVGKHLRPYFALDLTGIKSKGDKTLSGGIVYSYQEQKIIQWGIGLMPAIGFEMYLTRNLSVAAESRLRLLYNYTTTNVIKSNTGTYTQQSQCGEILINRIGGLTFNFNF